MPGRDILLVDDNDDLRETLADVLEIQGYRVRTACNGKVGLEMIAERTPALVLLDLMMPVMTGWEMREAMMRDPRLRSVPVVAVSASNRAPPPGVRLLTKPVPLDELLETIRRFAPGLEPTRSRPAVNQRC